VAEEYLPALRPLLFPARLLLHVCLYTAIGLWVGAAFHNGWRGMAGCAVSFVIAGLFLMLLAIGLQAC
jgi:hypothetical protein